MPECASCGLSVDEDDSGVCSVCGETFCFEDCLSTCEEGETKGRPQCGEFVCEKDKKVCDKCGATLCQKCFKSHDCGSLSALKLHDKEHGSPKSPSLTKLLKHNMAVAVGVSFMFGPLIYFMVGKNKQNGGS